ncbi:MAG: DegT/DnrJ/EryC1/StrS family aminotransferase [Candidatus Peribacteraceae bacterium]|nr:DegT/DnrJ/EryC1/StrS family aminotransferase [Candidatus Peribacteraceae bacterium]MDD5742212.1 DegT/DnrJ/EryC1/StrS family aminotransferase [Candidatus Peribacteraceae bacterium]
MISVPVNEPVIPAEARQYVLEALESGWVSSAGKFIQEFEEAFARYLGVKHAITATSGTAALHLSLSALGIGPGDEVIVPDFTMIASAYAVLYTGASPVFVDCDPETFTLDVSQLEAKITPLTKAIMPVHIYGHAADMDPILALARERKLSVVEDAAEAHGAEYKGRLCGTMGTVNAFSFYGNKIITTGEGGMVTTDDDAIAERVRSLKDLAHSPAKRFVHESIGFNYRMTNLQAALGLGQMKHIGEFLRKKQWMAQRYFDGLQDIAGLRLPVTKSWAKNVYWMYAVLVEDSFGMTRDAFRAELKTRGIDTRDFFTSCAAQPAIRALTPAPFGSAQGLRQSLRQGPFPVTEDIAERGLYLPSGLALTEEQIAAVIAAVHSIAHG